MCAAERKVQIIMVDVDTSSDAFLILITYCN
jgi:hypothetical protein